MLLLRGCKLAATAQSRAAARALHTDPAIDASTGTTAELRGTERARRYRAGVGMGRSTQRDGSQTCSSQLPRRSVSIVRANVKRQSLRKL
jgi:hypothetical protein